MRIKGYHAQTVHSRIFGTGKASGIYLFLLFTKSPTYIGLGAMEMFQSRTQSTEISQPIGRDR